MKKVKYLFLLVSMLMLDNVQSYAQFNPIKFQVRYVDPTENQTNPTRGPITIPEVGLNDYTLAFDTPCDSCTLCLEDSTGQVVYSLLIPVGCDTLVLPYYLSGEYEIQIVSCIYCFFGRIEFGEED